MGRVYGIHPRYWVGEYLRMHAPYNFFSPRCLLFSFPPLLIL